MKKLIVALLSLVLLLVVAVVAIPFLIPKDRIITEVQNQVKIATGRELKLAGDIDISVWPSLSVVMNDVSFANASWGQSPYMVTLDQLDVKLDTRALLNKQVRVDRFVLNKPVIFLEKNKTGQGNWEIEIAKGDAVKKDTAKTDAPADQTAGAENNMALALGDMRIVGGDLSYHDHKTGQKERLQNINVDVAVADFTSPLTVKGDVNYRSEDIGLNVYFDKAQSLIDQKPVVNKSSISVAGATVEFSGNVTPSSVWRAAGTLKASASDLKRLLKFAQADQDLPINTADISADVDLAADKMSFKNLNLKTEAAEVMGDAMVSLAKTWAVSGEMSVNVTNLKQFTRFAEIDDANVTIDQAQLSSVMKLSPEKMSFDKMALKIDGLDASGQFSMSLGGPRPSVTGGLTLSKLDVDRYLPKSSGLDNLQSDQAKQMAKSQKQAAGWDTTPIDFMPLRKVDADLSLLTNGVHYQGLELGANKTTLKLKNGHLNVSMSETAVFDGEVKGDIAINAAGPSPIITADLIMAGVQAKPALVHFADFEKLTGTAESQVTLKTVGSTQAAMVNALNGQGYVTFRDGAMQGIDLARWAKLIQSRVNVMELGEGKTEFVEMGGSFNIVNGLFSNSDLKLVGPMVSATGNGTADLPKQYVAYRVMPKLSVTTSKEQANVETGEMEIVKTTSALSVPVNIKGPFSNVKVKPDYGSVIKDALKDPKQLEQNLKTIKDQAKTIGKALEDDKGKAAEQILNNLIKGF